MASNTRRQQVNIQILQTARDALVKKGLYLGTPNVASQLAWQRIGNLHQYLATTKDVETASAHNEGLDPITEASLIDFPPYAVLSAIVFVPSEDYWLTSCGMWKPEHNYPFANVRPTCTGQAPTQPIVSDDFSIVIQNMDAIIKSTNGLPTFKGALVKSASTGNRKLKFRHTLFQQIEHGENESIQSEETDSEPLPFEYTIKGWPVQSEDAKCALEDIKSTHRVCHIPAFDVNSKLIHPLQYRQHLQNATLQIHFRLNYWAFPTKDRTAGSATYACDIVSMRVLIPPPSLKGPSLPKRKFTLTDPFAPEAGSEKVKDTAETSRKRSRNTPTATSSSKHVTRSSDS